MSEFINLFDIPEIAEKVRKEEERLTESVEFGIPELKKDNVWVLQDGKGNYQICQGTGFTSTKSYPYSEIDGKQSSEQAKIILKHIKKDKLPVKLSESYDEDEKLTESLKNKDDEDDNRYVKYFL